MDAADTTNTSNPPAKIALSKDFWSLVSVLQLLGTAGWGAPSHFVMYTNKSDQVASDRSNRWLEA